MRTEHLDIAIIGGGCAGLCAAIAAKKAGADKVVVFERSPYLGGVLKQCIHNGFGIHYFGEDLTGTQYAKRLTDIAEQSDIRCKTSTIVLQVSKNRNITALSSSEGLKEYKAKAVVIATGCRERSRGALLIAGTRPAGVITAGAAQKYLNIDGYLAGKKIVILGSGDIGLIMARQFVLEGAQVLGVAEVLPYSGGLMRNIVQCLDDFDIPIYYNTTVTRIVGQRRVEGVYLAEVDENRKPIKETERLIECNTLVLSVGLIPENELADELGVKMSAETKGAVVDDTLETSAEGIYACGNALHVHDLVDFVSAEGEIAGNNAALYAAGNLKKSHKGFVVVAGGYGVSAVVPQKIRTGAAQGEVKLQFRPTGRFEKSKVAVYCGSEKILSKKHLILTPGEMCELCLDRAKIGADLRIEVEC